MNLPTDINIGHLKSQIIMRYLLLIILLTLLHSSQMPRVQFSSYLDKGPLEAAIGSAGQEISTLLWKPKI